MKAFLIVVACLVIGGCSSMGGNPFAPPDHTLTATQLREMVKDKNGAVICVVAPTPWGMVHMTTVNLDQAARTTAGVSVDPNCKVEMNTSTPPPEPQQHHPQPTQPTQPQSVKEKTNG